MLKPPVLDISCTWLRDNILVIYALRIECHVDNNSCLLCVLLWFMATILSQEKRLQKQSSSPFEYDLRTLCLRATNFRIFWNPQLVIPPLIHIPFSYLIKVNSYNHPLSWAWFLQVFSFQQVLILKFRILFTYRVFHVLLCSPTFLNSYLVKSKATETFIFFSASPSVEITHSRIFNMTYVCCT